MPRPHMKPAPQLDQAEQQAFTLAFNRLCKLADVHAPDDDVEGWALFDSDSRGMEIERVDDVARFEGDDDALTHVVAQAEAGNIPALLACAVHFMQRLENALRPKDAV